MSDIKSIVIVGGGSAGWMAATYLNKVLNPVSEQVKITLVESPDIETIGVGEATVPTIIDFFKAIDVSETELMVKTNATIKSAIKFVDWYEKDGSGYFHPFEAPLFSDGIEISAHWAALKQKGRQVEDFALATGILPSLCEENKTPKRADIKDYEAPTLYAYHLDAVLMAKFLRETALSRGVTRLEDKVEKVNLNDEGEISSLTTEKNGEIVADFFVDCTGFASLLLQQTLKQKFVSFADELLCNSAVALQTPYSENEPFAKPYTTATAKSNGWIWEIGLAKRKGNGYVFSDQFQSFEEAEAEFREHLGKSADGLEVRKLRMKIGRPENFWFKNCLAIGLSGGFVEPLESTGLQFIHAGLEHFVEFFPTKTNYQALQNRYNKLMSAKFDDVKDFIVLHYCLTNREDSAFWRHIKHDLKISDSLSEQLEIWRSKLPTHSDLKEIGLFGAPNYMYILAGMNHLVHPGQSKLANIPTERSERLLNQLKQFQNRASQLAPLHQQYISDLHKMYNQ